MFGHLMFVYFLFLTVPFYTVTNRIFFIGTASDLPSTFFCFCNTCSFVTFRTSFGVAGSNIILLYSGMASKFTVTVGTTRILHKHKTQKKRNVQTVRNTTCHLTIAHTIRIKLKIEARDWKTYTYIFNIMLRTHTQHTHPSLMLVTRETSPGRNTFIF